MEGILRCSRYAFGPNRLHYCGPDQNRELFAYMKEGTSDPGLETMLKAFRTMYPYLRQIARSNDIRDPFDERVVEAYWIGNELLERVEGRHLYRHLIEEQEIKKRIGPKSFEWVARKIGQGAVPHHSFHVLDIWKRTGHAEQAHTLESMEECRVGWGKVIEASGPAVAVMARPLVLENGKLALGEERPKRLTRALEAADDIAELAPGQLVAFHWSVPCETVTPHQAAMLERYTLRHIALANQTL